MHGRQVLVLLSCAVFLACGGEKQEESISSKESSDRWAAEGLIGHVESSVFRPGLVSRNAASADVALGLSAKGSDDADRVDGALIEAGVLAVVVLVAGFVDGLGR